MFLTMFLILLTIAIVIGLLMLFRPKKFQPRQGWTLQTIYDVVKVGLLKQGERSTDPNGYVCKFRGAEGRKCAIGFLIPDYLYEPGMEGGLVNALNALKIAFGRDITDQDRALMGRLMRIHDDGTPSTWPERLRQVALDFNLKP